jgi:hypothetical protein
MLIPIRCRNQGIVYSEKVEYSGIQKSRDCIPNRNAVFLDAFERLYFEKKYNICRYLNHRACILKKNTVFLDAKITRLYSEINTQFSGISKSGDCFPKRNTVPNQEYQNHGIVF